MAVHDSSIPDVFLRACRRLLRNETVDVKAWMAENHGGDSLPGF